MANKTIYLEASVLMLAEEMQRDDRRSLSNLVCYLVQQEWLRRQIRDGDVFTAKSQSPQSFPVMEKR